MARPKRNLITELKTHLPKGRRLLLAVSGGMDSVCLLDGACKVRKLLKVEIGVAHFNHRLRKSSARDLRFVRELARRYEVPFFEGGAEGRIPRSNVEAWARGQRYAFFAGIMRENGYDHLVTAHTANDQAETLLMRLVSNKEPKAILRRDDRRQLLRPMLGLERAAIESYVRTEKLEFVTDESNADTRYLRNRVRHKVLPLLKEEFDPRIVESLSNRASIIAEDIDALYALGEEPCKRIRTHKEWSRPWLRALRSELSALPPAVRWRLVETLLFSKFGFNIGHAAAHQFLDLVEGKIKAVQLPAGVSARLSGGGILIAGPTRNAHDKA